MKTIAQLLFLTLVFSGCARMCNKVSRDYQVSDRTYEVTVYSGGKAVQTYRFHGMLNNQENSDGYYWYDGDTLFEVSGTSTVRSWR